MAEELLFHRALTYFLLAVVLSLFTINSVTAASLDEVTSSLLADIRTSQKQLDEESREITRQSEALARQITQESNGLRILRKKAAAVTRQSDEQMVGLATLEQRIEAWRTQDLYRQNLLREFANRQHNEVDFTQASESSGLQNAIDSLERDLNPIFFAVDAVTESGEIIRAERLSVGPIHWFWTPDSSGLLYSENDETLRIAHRFDRENKEAVDRVKNLETGLLPFDPTIDRLLKTRVEPPNLLEQMALGGIWIAPILAFGLLATLIAITKSIQFLRLPRLVPFTPGMGAAKLLASLPAGPQREIVAIATSVESTDQRDDMLFAFLVGQRSHLERFLGAIAVTATVSPLLGLLGTVSGMISTFNMMTLFGSGDPSVVSGGISEALVTTELGLIVAIPALIMHALLSRKANSYIENLETSAVALASSNGADQ